MRLTLLAFAGCSTAFAGCSTAEPDLELTSSEPDATEVEIPAYERKLWRHWIDADKDCQDARQEVLIRDSQEPVTFTDEKQCRVATGKWICPYTGKVITDPSKVDVDHVVALKDAHDSGGWSWTPEQRKAFANNLEPDHLVASSQYGNRSKGAKGPDEWLPPLAEARCPYLNQWMSLKQEAGLQFEDKEHAVLLYMKKICDDGLVPPLPQ